MDLLHKSVVSGLGESIGRVVGLATGARGEILALEVAEDGTPLGRLRLVEPEHVARVGAEVIHLKGPRQGYHITRLGAGR